jgi:hypothetical protein
MTRITRLVSAAFALCALSAPCVQLQAKPQPPTDNTTYIGAFPGGRALSMGYAMVSVGGGDTSSIYFNPAGIGPNDESLFSVSYEAVRQSELATAEIFGNEMLRNKNVVFLGLVAKGGAISWRPLADSVWRNTSGADWAETELKINAFTLSASHKHSDSFYSGLNISYLNARVAESGILGGIPSANIADGNGMTSDFGVIYIPSPELHLGANLQNIASYVWWDDYENEQLPFILRTGFSYQIARMTTFSTDWEKRFYRKGDQGEYNVTHFGFEQNLGSMLALRGGIYGDDLNDRESTHVTAGFGFTKNSYTISLSGERYRLNKTDVYRYLFSLDLPL